MKNKKATREVCQPLKLISQYDFSSTRINAIQFILFQDIERSIRMFEYAIYIRHADLCGSEGVFCSNQILNH